MAADLSSGVLFGAAYYAEYQPYDRLVQDLDLMARAGFTVIRARPRTCSPAASSR
jgi:beta-galactosidase